MSDKTPIKMLHDRILCEGDTEAGERRSSGGIVIPATAAMGARRLAWSRVVAVGPHCRAVVAGDEEAARVESGLQSEKVLYRLANGGRDIEVDKTAGRTAIYCGDKLAQCEFGKAKSSSNAASCRSERIWSMRWLLLKTSFG